MTDTYKIHEVLKMEPGTDEKPLELTLLGWAKEVRIQKNGRLLFIKMSDGYSLKRLQIVFEIADEVPIDQLPKPTYESAIEVTGYLVPSPAKGQSTELKATQITIIGPSDSDAYPFPKGKDSSSSMEHLRTYPHLRPKTNIINAIMRVKHKLQLATHIFYDSHDFCWIQTPILTGSDCEGAGETFNVTSPNEPKFFRQTAHLTVSGQLHVEPFALGMGGVYVLGPSFRAEKSQTTRHLSEFWMLEPEMICRQLEDLLGHIESYLKTMISSILEQCPDELAACIQRYGRSDLIETLKRTVAEPFATVTYAEALKILQAAVATQGQTFEKPCEWGVDFGADQERYLCEVHFKRPTFITHYPAHIKAFYMYQDDLPEGASPDHQTVACVDCLFPGIGEVVGGSQREHRLSNLEKAITQFGLNPTTYSWYLDTRRFGTIPHAGFGVGMDRLLRFLTGSDHIMDLVPYPVRYDYPLC